MNRSGFRGNNWWYPSGLGAHRGVKHRLKWAAVATALLSACDACHTEAPDNSGRLQEPPAHQKTTTPSPTQTVTAMLDAGNGASAGTSPGVSLCGLCSRYQKTPWAGHAQNESSKPDWTALLDHPFSIPKEAGIDRFSAPWGLLPTDLRTSLGKRARVKGLERYARFARLRWQKVLREGWFDDSWFQGELALPETITYYDAIVLAQKWDAHFVQLLTTRSCMAIRTDFEPQCGTSSPEQLAAALSLAETMLADLPRELCSRPWQVVKWGTVLSGSMARLPAPADETWADRLKLVVDGRQVLISFCYPSMPIGTGKSFGGKRPSWFHDKSWDFEDGKP